MLEQFTGILSMIGGFVIPRQPESTLEAYIAARSPQSADEVEQLIREYDTDKMLYNRRIALE